LQSTYQNTRQTLGFQKNMISKIPPGGGGANVFLSLYHLLYSFDHAIITTITANMAIFRLLSLCYDRK